MAAEQEVHEGKRVEDGRVEELNNNKSGERRRNRQNEEKWKDGSRRKGEVQEGHHQNCQSIDQTNKQSIHTNQMGSPHEVRSRPPNELQTGKKTTKQIRREGKIKSRGVKLRNE